jgi:hypothetical protein
VTLAVDQQRPRHAQDAFPEEPRVREVHRRHRDAPGGVLQQQTGPRVVFVVVVVFVVRPRRARQAEPSDDRERDHGCQRGFPRAKGAEDGLDVRARRGDGASLRGVGEGFFVLVFLLALARLRGARRGARAAPQRPQVGSAARRPSLRPPRHELCDREQSRPDRQRGERGQRRRRRRRRRRNVLFRSMRHDRLDERDVDVVVVVAGVDG